MHLAVVRTDPLERLLAELRRRLTPEEYAALRRRFESRRRTIWHGLVRRALRGATSEAERAGIRLRARAFPRAPRDDLDLSFRRIAAARERVPAHERRAVTRRRTRAEFHRLVGDGDEDVAALVVELVVSHFYPHLP